MIILGVNLPFSQPWADCMFASVDHSSYFLKETACGIFNL